MGLAWYPRLAFFPAGHSIRAAGSMYASFATRHLSTDPGLERAIAMRLTSVVCVCLTTVLWLPASAAAQRRFQAIGESYSVEILAGGWFPPPNPVLSRDAPNATGSDINFVTDLGVTSERFAMWRFTLRTAARQKARIERLPLSYDAEAAPTRTLTFDGTQFAAGLPTTSALDWTAWRFGYEYDVVAHERGYLGFIGELKYSNVSSRLQNAAGAAGSDIKVVIPGVGVVGRVYLVSFIALGAEITGSSLGSDGSNQRKYLDYDVSGVINFSEGFGLQGGTRSMFVRYRVDADAGEIEVREKYFAAVVRF